MLATVLSSALQGIDATVVEVEVDVATGMPQFRIVGLPEAAVRESHERVRSAIRNSGYPFPSGRITINLAPADLRKGGSAYDLPIAIGLLAADRKLPTERLSEFAILGELSLDGRVKPMRGALPSASAAASYGVRSLVVPLLNAPEATLVAGIDVYGVTSLAEACALVSGHRVGEPCRIDVESIFAGARNDEIDLADVRGQEHAKRALEVTAARVGLFVPRRICDRWPFEKLVSK